MARHLEWPRFWSGAVFLLSVFCCGMVTSTPLRKCYFYDSSDGRNRTCTLTSSAGACFSFIRRTTDNNYRWKRGCSANCADDRRNRKIQICCTTNLCNTHVLTPNNFSSSSDVSPQTTPAFSTTHQMASRSSMVTVAPSVTIVPPQLVPIVSDTEGNNDNTEPVVSNQPPNEYFTCNCNNCGGLSECVGTWCVASFTITADSKITYDYSCSNSSVCPEGLVCCSIDRCNAEVVRTEKMSTTAGGHASPSSTITRINAGATTRGLDISAEPAADYSEKYFTIATAVSVVGGVLVVCVIFVILACIIFRFRQKTASVKLVRQSSPPSIVGRSGSIIKPTPSPSYSLNSTASNSESSNANSNSTMSDSCNNMDMDNPLKYLGTRV